MATATAKKISWLRLFRTTLPLLGKRGGQQWAYSSKGCLHCASFTTWTSEPWQGARVYRRRGLVWNGGRCYGRPSLTIYEEMERMIIQSTMCSVQMIWSTQAVLLEMWRSQEHRNTCYNLLYIELTSTRIVILKKGQPNLKEDSC